MTASKTPKLRFKDENSNTFPDWENLKIGDIGELKTSSVDKLSKEGEKEAYLLNYMDVYKRDHIYKTDIFQKITAKDTQIIENNLLKGDILFTPSSETPTDIGHSAVVVEDLDGVLYSYHLMRLRPKSNRLNIKFSGYAFKTFNFYKELWKRAQGATRYTLSVTSLKESKINIPQSTNEQEKIAEFLSSVDKYIQNLKSQKEELEKYKKAVMQKIFSQQLRFKDSNGKDFPDWKIYKFNDFLIEKNIKSKINNQYEVVSSTIGGIFSQKEFFNREIASKNNIGYKVIELNDLVFSPQNLWLGNININQKFKVGIVSPSYKIYRIKEDVVLIELLKHLIKSNRMMYEYELSSDQGASVVRRNLNIELFNSIPIRLPGILEQKKISEFISFIDNLIDNKNNKIKHAENWKKGLMQDMFI